MQTGKAWKYGTENLPIGDKTETHFTNKGKSTDFFEKRLYKLQNRWYYNITPRALRQKQNAAAVLHTNQAAEIPNGAKGGDPEAWFGFPPLFCREAACSNGGMTAVNAEYLMR